MGSINDIFEQFGMVIQEFVGAFTTGSLDLIK